MKKISRCRYPSLSGTENSTNMSNPESKPDVIHHVNNEIMKFKYLDSIEEHPAVHTGMNAFYLQMRQEVHNIHQMHLRARKKKMRELFIQDFLQQDQELREVEYAFTNNQF